MADEKPPAKVIHPQFAIKSPRRVQAQRRSVLFITNQMMYDAILYHVDNGIYPNPQKLFEAALEKLLELPPGTADPNNV